MAMTLENRKAEEVLKALYKFAGISYPFNGYKAGKQVTTLVTYLMQEIEKGSAAISLVPKPTYTPSSTWLVLNGMRIVKALTDGKIPLSKSAVKAVLYKNRNPLAVAFLGDS